MGNKMSFEEAMQYTESASVEQLEALLTDFGPLPRLVEVMTMGKRRKLDAAIEARLHAAGRSREVRDQEWKQKRQERREFFAADECPQCGGKLKISVSQSGGGPFPPHQTRTVACARCDVRVRGERYCLSGEGTPSPDGKGMRGGEPRWEKWRLK